MVGRLEVSLSEDGRVVISTGSAGNFALDDDAAICLWISLGTQIHAVIADKRHQNIIRGLLSLIVALIRRHRPDTIMSAFAGNDEASGAIDKVDETVEQIIRYVEKTENGDAR